MADRKGYCGLLVEGGTCGAGEVLDQDRPAGMNPAAPTVNAIFDLEEDISELLPYLNATLQGCFYEPTGPYLRFMKEGKAVTLHARQVTITRLEDEEEARRVMEWLVEVMRSTHANRGRIQPSYRRRAELKLLDVYRLLPRSNCGRCGEPACLAFAAKVASGERGARDCPVLCEPGNEERLARLEEALGQGECWPDQGGKVMHPEEYRYSKTHEWAKVEGDLVRVGRGPAGLVRGCRSRRWSLRRASKRRSWPTKAPGLATWCFAGSGAGWGRMAITSRVAPGVLHRYTPCELEINREAVHVMDNHHEGDLTLTGKS